MMVPLAAAAHWRLGGIVRLAPDAGLINCTWLVGDPVEAVLQWVNPIFAPEVNLDIDTLVSRLESMGLPTPRLVPGADGGLWLADPDGGCWRVLTYVVGHTRHRLSDPAMAREAGALVGRFHAAVHGWDLKFVAPRRKVHDTPARMTALRSALDRAGGHALAAPARDVGERVLAAWQTWDGELDLPARLCHGDLKISNLRFDDHDRAICLIDLDTIGRMPYACELGDAWRSWCNPSGEDEVEAVAFDVDLFEAAALAWLSEAPVLDTHERNSLVPGIERICLELAARFCTDAVANTYFREDRERWPQPGAHNLHRARVQVALAASARSRRAACERVILCGSR